MYSWVLRIGEGKWKNKGYEGEKRPVCLRAREEFIMRKREWVE